MDELYEITEEEGEGGVEAGSLKLSPNSKFEIKR